MSSSSCNERPEFEQPPLYAYLSALLVYFVINITGKFRNFLESIHWIESRELSETSDKLRTFPPLYNNFERFYFKYVFVRIRDNFEYRVCGTPGAVVTIQKRTTEDYNWNYQYVDEYYEVINMGSYNYLGFAQNEGPVANDVVQQISHLGLGVASSRHEVGSMVSHRELEHLVANFLGVEDAMVVPQGFATNSLNIPAIMNEDNCIISDECNHASLILGCRMAGAKTFVFKHNNMKSLESQLIKAVQYKTKTGKSVGKIFIVVEGIYSMEGSIVPLPEVIALKYKYGAYLYLDEAHSIGAIGGHGRGVLDYYGANPRDVDILMGTFTKSFASAGGYVAGSAGLIQYMRMHSQAYVYGGCMSPAASAQIKAALQLIMAPEGKQRIKQLAWNTRYFRTALHKMRLIVLGSRDSPVVPVLVLSPSHITMFGRLAQERGLGAAVVGYPATKLTEARVRFCMSASHTKEMLDKALGVIDELASIMHLRYSRRPLPAWCRGDMAEEPLCSNNGQPIE